MSTDKTSFFFYDKKKLPNRWRERSGKMFVSGHLTFDSSRQVVFTVLVS